MDRRRVGNRAAFGDNRLTEPDLVRQVSFPEPGRMSSADLPNDRVVDLELLLTHLQRDFEQLNSVVLEQRKEIETLVARMDRLERHQQPVSPPPPATGEHDGTGPRDHGD